MAEYGLLSPVITLFVNEVWKPMKKHIGYCLKPGTDVRNLAKAADDLKDTTDTIEEKIQLGEREGKRPRGQAARISSAATNKKGDVDELKKTTPQNDSIFSLLRPVGRVLPLPPNIVGQEEYKDRVRGYIEQGTVSIIGICGMGGVGKTTLLKQINNNFSCAAEMREFDHVIYVEVGRQQNLATIQQNIASQLGLTLGQDESTTSSSASLYNFLKGRKFLLLIDDLWQTLDLETIGIPQGCRQNRQMIIITARLQQVCYSMQAHDQVIVLERLKFNEAWCLFEANTGKRLTNSAHIRDLADKIVRKCAGLPLALKIVGQAMASKVSEHEWIHAVMLLEQSQLHKVPDAESDLYSVLYVSYDHLPDERTKQCFLLFALTSGTTRYVLHTIDFWMGHGLLDEDDDIESSYLRGHSVVGCLKRACLLEEAPRGGKYLRMHDIIGDLALWIVSTKQGDGCNKKWITCDYGKHMEPKDWSSAERICLWGNNAVTVPNSCSNPHLLTLILNLNRVICKVPKGFFETSRSLTYLDLRATNIQELPSDVGALVNLQHLNLSETPIRSLPVELRLLQNLRYLHLAFTRDLNIIPDGTIPALRMLRVLDLYATDFFQKDVTWGYIEELERLTWLRFLGFTVADFGSLHRIFNLSKASLRSLEIQGMEGLQCLHISPKLVGKMSAEQLERLSLGGMESLKELLIGEINVDVDWHFRRLDELLLWELPELESIIWKEVVPHACLPRLRMLFMYKCDSIENIKWIKQLPCLEDVYLVDCNSLSELVTDDEDGTMSCTTTSFPRLKLLGLSKLTKLHNICDASLEFPCLRCLLVYMCPMLAKLPSKLLNEGNAPLILGEQDWWGQLDWEDTSVKSTLFSFFRELFTSFEGSDAQVRRGLWNIMEGEISK